MKTVDPLPAQIASMNKETILKLLKLLMGGTLLQSGSSVNMKVSRWAWALLGRLPVRGELSSEEIGVVRELGKKAVLVGMGLKAGNGLKEGLDEMEKAFEAEKRDEVLVSEDAIRNLGVGTGVSGNEDQVGVEQEPKARTKENKPMSHSNNNAWATTTEEEVTLDPQELEATKARLLANIAPDSTTANEPAAKALPAQSPAAEEPIPPTTETSMQTTTQTDMWNTRATLDMIITIAGEMYGQRDLLEFREVWGE